MKLAELKAAFVRLDTIVAEGAMKEKFNELLDAVSSEFNLDVSKPDDEEMVNDIANWTLGEDVKGVDEFLYHFFSANGEMPYGTQKARDGDPANWVADHMEDLFKKYTKGM